MKRTDGWTTALLADEAVVEVAVPLKAKDVADGRLDPSVLGSCIVDGVAACRDQRMVARVLIGLNRKLDPIRRQQPKLVTEEIKKSIKQTCQKSNTLGHWVYILLSSLQISALLALARHLQHDTSIRLLLRSSIFSSKQISRDQMTERPLQDD